jgi:glucose/arabinose dehydrogenase
MKFTETAVLFTMGAVATWAQANVGEQKPEASLPFTMTTVTTFKLPWRLAFLPDGRVLITEKPGPVWLVSQQGEKIQVENTPPVFFQGQNGMHGVFLSPHYGTDHSIYLTYAEPGEYGEGLALARAKLNATATSVKLENFEVLWHQMLRGRVGRKARRSPSPPTASFGSLQLATVSASPPPMIQTSPKGRSCA